MKAYDEDDIVKLHKCTQDVFQAAYKAEKDETSQVERQSRNGFGQP